MGLIHRMKLFFALALLCVAVYASSHSEAPGTAKSPSSDVSDFYMFQCYEPGREDRTCFIMNAYPVQNPFGGPNYFTLSDDHFFEIYIDNNGDAREDITFQFFTGNRLAGPMVEVPFQSDEDDCAIYTRSAAPRPLTEMKHGGLTLNIDGMDIPVPLKFIGPISAVDDANLNWIEYYRLNVIRGDRTFGDRTPVTISGDSTNTTAENLEFRKPFDYAGTKTLGTADAYETYARQFEYEVTIPGCDAGAARVFVGQRAEGFNINLGGIFDLINLNPLTEVQNIEDNDLAGINVSSFVLEIPTECIVGEEVEEGVIGAWTGVRKLHHSGDGNHVPGKQVSRLGSPLVNEVVIGLRDKAAFNAQEPAMDGVSFLKYVTNPTLPAIISLLFGEAVLMTPGANIAPTNFPRNDLVAAFLTGIEGINQPVNVAAAEMLRLNTSTPVVAAGAQMNLGVIGGDAAGFPNGRRPGDDVVDIALRVVMGRLCHIDGLGFCTPEQAPVGTAELTDGVPVDASYFDNAFPYLRVPTPGAGDPTPVVVEV